MPAALRNANIRFFIYLQKIKVMKRVFSLPLAAFVILLSSTSCFGLLDTDSPGGSKNYVDLGLSVKWATCNLGATSPEKAGNYYAWGETSPKSEFSWDSYKWTKKIKSTYGDEILVRSKYNSASNLGTVDNKTVLDPEDDAAHVKLGGKWRMPTKAEFQELIDKCEWTLTTRSGVSGFEVKSKSNGKSIFLPFTGYYGPGKTLNNKDQGNLWVSEMDRNSNFSCYFKKGTPGSWWGISREYGLAIRPVCD